MPKRLLLAGAGHAHMTVLQHLADLIGRGIEVTVVGPGPVHYYSGMGPGMLGGTYEPAQISFPVKEMVERAGGTFLVDQVTGLEPRARKLFTKGGAELAYDVISFNTGSAIPDETVDDDTRIFRVKPIENLLAARERILELAKQKTVSIGVVGGGPGALEVAGNAWDLARQGAGQGASVSVYGGRHFLNKVPSGVESRARKVFAQRGIVIEEGAYASKVSGGRVELGDGRVGEHDLVFLATGVRPRPLFGPSGLPTGPDGGLAVNRYLQSSAFPDVFGGGDCIFFEPQPLNKVGVYAVRQNPVLLHNLQARLSGGELQPFDPGGAYLLIYNLGGGIGIFHKWGLVFGGKLAFGIKDYIDRRFMENFKPDWDK